MSTFQGFIFKNPDKKATDNPESDTKEQDDDISKLSDRLSQITADDDQFRHASFKALRAPLSSRSMSDTQEKRRLKALELQKNQRNISISKARKLALGINEEDSSGEDEEDEVSQKRKRDSDDDIIMHDNKLKKFEMGKRKTKNKKNFYTDQIMYSETMETVPEDFMENWVMMICPKGKRCLVTSGGGYTVARSRRGFIINKFQSVLPNGSRSRRSTEFCILDCIYDPLHWTFYVLDIMSWKGYSIFDCDTNFRHFWLQTKIQENEFDRPNNENQFYKFVALKPVDLTDKFQEVIRNPKEYIKQNQHLDYDIDGLLFYHKEAHYRGGTTPLVCWVANENVADLFSSGTN